MLKPADPRNLAIALLSRSICSVQVAAVLVDWGGIFSWGWNSVGSGYGEHAEAACLRRANRRRLVGAVMYVAARRRKSGNIITARPCDACQGLVRRVGSIMYRDSVGEWRKMWL